MRDYTKGHPTIEGNNHPIRHGAVVGVHNGIILNDEELFEQHGSTRAQPEMTVDSEAIFALVEETDEVLALEQLHGSMATAWIDERDPGRPRGRPRCRPAAVARPRARGDFFASTKHTLELIERYLDLRLSKREVPEGSRVTLGADGTVDWASLPPGRVRRGVAAAGRARPRGARIVPAPPPRARRGRASKLLHQGSTPRGRRVADKQGLCPRASTTRVGQRPIIVRRE